MHSKNFPVILSAVLFMSRAPTLAMVPLTVTSALQLILVALSPSGCKSIVLAMSTALPPAMPRARTSAC